MADEVNGAGAAKARSLIAAGNIIDAPWSFSAADGNALLGANGDDWTTYGSWHLGIDPAAAKPQTKAYYEYPFGKGGKLYVSALRAIRSRSAQEGDMAIFAAAGKLMDALPKPKPKAASDVMHKITVQKSNVAPGADYVMSDETVDRYGDVVSADGWDLKNFKRNPIALFNHNPDMPVGQWQNVRVEGKALKGTLALIPPVSDRMREIQAAVDAGVLRAASVGFKSIKSEPRPGGSGYNLLQNELVECSLVSTPANPNALQVVKSLMSSGKLSVDTARMICGEQAMLGQSEVRRNATIGAQAGSKIGAMLHSRTNQMTTLSEKIQRSQDRVNNYKLALENQADTVDDENEESREAYARISTELARKLDSEAAYLEGLQRSERQLGETSDPVEVVERRPGTAIAKTVPAVAPPSFRNPFPMPKIEVKPRDYVFHALTGALLSHIQKRPVHDVITERYGGDELSHRVTDSLILRASTVPATMTGSSWADTLIQTVIADFVGALMPMSVYPGLSERGLRFTFNNNGAIVLPTRPNTPTVGGAFVLDGNAIPVKQASFNGVTIVPKKMGVITTFTRQIAEHSTPAIEGLLRDALQQDTSVAIDTVLLDATASSTTRPAGLLNGVSSSVKSSLSGFNSIVGDVKTLLGVLIAANSLRMPTWIMNPANVLSLELDPNANGEFPFAADAARGMLAGYPILASTTMTSGTILLIDAADFATATGDTPNFMISDQAVLHMEDTSPTNIGVSSTAVFPVRSMFQTDSIALRMIMDISWVMRRTGVIAYTSGVNW